MSHSTHLTILVTGGHLTPALATLAHLKHHSTRLYFVGRRFVNDNRVPSREQTEVEAIGVDFIPYRPPKFHRKPLHKNLPELAKLPAAIRTAFQILDQTQPRLILSFGGYLALPLAIAAAFRHIPILTHEQTTQLGLANRIISRLATATALSWPPDLDHPPYPSKLGPKTFLTGNPVRPQFLRPQPAPAWVPRGAPPLLYVTGGNQGSLALNSALYPLLPGLTHSFFVVHQRGSANPPPPEAYPNLISRPWFPAAEAAWLLQHASLVVSRSGANTAAELLLTRTPAILVPLPASANQEQLRNAQVLQALGLARILTQDQLSRLGTLIRQPTRPQPNLPVAEALSRLHRQAALQLTQLALLCAAGKDTAATASPQN